MATRNETRESVRVRRDVPMLPSHIFIGRRRDVCLSLSHYRRKGQEKVVGNPEISF
jgi:hypothetical protein